MPMRKEILIVEDNEINREMLSEILSVDYRVLGAENGQVALNILKEHKSRFSLILLDVQMPVMDGYIFLDRVKEDAELSLIPVIVMTQSNSEADELAALAHGATDFLSKPYRPQIILHRVAGLIKLRETSAMVNYFQYDRLTGLYSKEFFYQKVREYLLENPDENYCIIASNIDNFKLINDVMGMQEGDFLLKKVAEIIKNMVGNTGFCGRFGADRFLIFQKHTQGMNNCESAELEKLSRSFKNVVIRWGIYEITDRTVSVEQMCDRALLAADIIKNQYHQYFAVYDDSIRSKLLREQAITSEMESALNEGQFKIYLQPKYSLRDKCMCGAEALVRWTHPEWGFMSPAEFIPLFEKNGFIPKLDQYVWEQVCIQLSKWKEEGYPLLPISVNVSRADVYYGNLIENIYELTQKHGVDPIWMHLEITESAYTENPDRIVSTVEELRRLGFIIEMDDFGSGYSSLNMLSQMSLDILKMDMKFIQNEISKPANQSFLSDVISMAHRVNLSVVAEGVETREQMNRLYAAGCDYVQGYFFAKPMSVEEYEMLLRQQEVCFDPERQRSAMHQNCILVADEDAEYREMVKETFGVHYQIVETDSAGEALATINSSGKDRISAVILSAVLPEEGALSVMNTLRHTPDFWNIPVLITIPDNKCAMQLPIAREADDFLCKDHPLFDLQRRVLKMIDAASSQSRECALQMEACHDPLTNLLNRRGLENAVSEMDEADMPIAVCVFDVDNLKRVNDTYGHDMGDQILRSFAEQLCSKTRLRDVKCRYGGDEFVVILKNIGDEETARKKGESICRSFHEWGKEADFSTACSVGIVFCESGEEVSCNLIERADQALYHAKRENKGGCCVWKEV